MVLLMHNSPGQNKTGSKDTCSVLIPNSIAPAHDLKPWRIQSNCPLAFFKLVIYDKWGGKLHKQDTLGAEGLITWDYSNTPMDSYMYTLNYRLLSDTTLQKRINGFISIIR